MPALTLILYDTFGTDDRRAKLWNRLIAAPPGTEIPLTQGEQIVHLVHATDVVRAFLIAAELLHHGHSLESLYSAHSFCPRSLRELVTDLNDTASLRLTLRWGAIPYAKDQIFDPWVGETLPGWEPRINVLEALVQYASMHKVNTATHGVHVG
jgi:nucleoside-diphosphate-sugar epimerase